MEGGGLKFLALLIVVVVLMGAPDPTLGVEILDSSECSQPDCTNKCTEAYGDMLISATCENVPLISEKLICVCKLK
ncbi:unnamed protein product [Prunus armeniaca]|uniref:Uncharacterized protein n=1 Tax=Prunus armeniaca TaxID=36596 RepID=A0A6J5VJC5_PRUAR|nr:hypothetical protein GBA52_026431 [Prunus armeniaca]CAB4289169.1 unnamed protein product [Prunus armeniaca]CAB4319693.1 unnamed protein product [Prunus armeniaca]